MENTENKKKSTTKYRVVIGILIAIIAVLLWLLLFSKQETKVAETQKEDLRISLTSELDSLTNEHNLIKQEYGDLSAKVSEKDSVILAKTAEIKALIAKNADYNQIKRKLNYLRGIQQSYINQLDSMYTVNKHLNEELTVAHVQINQKNQEAQQLTQEKEELTKIVETGAQLKAYNVTGLTYILRGRTNREVETVKASRVERVKIRFTISENPLTKPGTKTVYVRIARPDGLILTKGNGDEYSFFANGTQLQYSLKQDIEYNNKAMDVVLNWDKQNNTPALKGNYDIAIYMDGKVIGKNQFTLE